MPCFLSPTPVPIHFDFKNTFTVLHIIQVLVEGCIRPKRCFSGWKDIKPWFIKTLSFLELSLGLQIHKPPPIDQQYLTGRRKILFLTLFLLVFFHPHTSSVYDDLHYLHFIPSPQTLHTSWQLITASKWKERIGGFFSLDNQNRMLIGGQKTIWYLWHVVYVVLTQMACFTLVKNGTFGCFPFFLQSFKRFHVKILKIILSQTEDI